MVPKKNEKWPAIAEIINWVFPLKRAKMNRSFLYIELLCVYSALAILEPQIYVVVEQFGAENISLLSERLVE